MTGPPEPPPSPIPSPNERQRWIRAVLALTPLAVIIVFLVAMLSATEGHFVPQIVDLYVVCQYAKAIAEGHAFQYNVGEPASTGATSLLHTGILALAHAVGIRGEGLVAFAISLGAALYAGTVLLARRIGSALAGSREGRLSGALVALGGSIVWGFLYGSDIALFMFLSTWLLERLLHEWESPLPRGSLLVASALALARPEGLVIALFLGLALTLAESRRPVGPRRILFWLPLGVAFSLLGLYRAVTGYWLGSSVADKSLLANYGPWDSLALVAEYGTDVMRGLLTGLYPSQVPIGFSRGWAPFFFPPLALLLMILGVLTAPPRFRPPLGLWTAIVGVLFALLSPNLFMGVHFNRYLLWAFPSLLVLTAAGLGALTRRLAATHADLESALFRVGAGLMLLFGLLSTVRFAVHYRDMAGDVYRRDVATARWISHNLPHGVHMLNLATSVEYLTGHRNTNLHGVTSPAFFGNLTAEREAGVFEALGRLPSEERAALLITSIPAQEAYPTMREFVQGPPLYRSSGFGDDILIHRVRYDLVGKNGRLFLPETHRAISGLEEVDRLNVCDRHDERDHGYRFTSRLANLSLHGTARIDAYALPDAPETVIDGGRAILGSESFAVRTRKEQDLVLVMRTAASVQANVLRAGGAGQLGIDLSEARINVAIDGESSARVAFRPRAGWDEQVVRIRGTFVKGDRTRIELSGRYGSFYYWFFQ